MFSSQIRLSPPPPLPALLRARFVRALDEKEPCHFNKDPPWNKTPLDILASPAATLPCLLGLFYIYILINAPLDLIVLIFPVHTWDKAELLPSCVDLPEILKNNFNCVRAFREKRKKKKIPSNRNLLETFHLLSVLYQAEYVPNDNNKCPCWRLKIWILSSLIFF